MDKAALLKRRQEVIDYHKLRETVDESPLSPKHVDMKNRDGSPKLPHSERPVAIQDDDLVYVVGEDVERVIEAVKGWLPAAEKMAAAPGQRGDLKYACKCCRELCDNPPETICLPTQRWNGILFALGDVGLLVVSTSLEG